MTEQEELKLYRKMFKHASEVDPNVFFICGQGGSRNERGLPETIIVCPADGLDEQWLYERLT